MKYLFCFLILSGASFANGSSSELHRILNQAIIANDATAIKQTFQLHVDVNQKNASGLYPIHFAVADGVKPDTLKLLLDYGANVDVTNNWGETPMHLAVKNNQIEKVKMLLEKGANCNVLNHGGQSPLHLTIAMPATASAMAEVLLAQKRCDPSLRDRRGFTPLVLSVVRRQPDAGLVKLLLVSGADKNELVFGKFTADEFAISQLNYFRKIGSSPEVISEQQAVVALVAK